MLTYTNVKENYKYIKYIYNYITRTHSIVSCNTDEEPCSRIQERLKQVLYTSTAQ